VKIPVVDEFPEHIAYQKFVEERRKKRE